MLSQSGDIDFTDELYNLVDAFLQCYQARKGTLQNDLERGLVIAYALGVLRCDLENVWDTLAQADVFGALQPRSLFEECAPDDRELRQSRQADILREMVARGWFTQAQHDER